MFIFQLFIQQLGFDINLRQRKSGTWRAMYKSVEKRHDRICKIEDLGVLDEYVYDLTTESGHFHVGPGTTVVHNTDSCFVHLSRELCDGSTPEELVENAHKVGEIMAADITKQFLKPVLMEYESAFEPPFVLLKKKRYFGKLCLPGKNPKVYLKGLECIRRDFCDLTIRTQKEFIHKILDGDMGGAIRHASEVLGRLCAGQIEKKDLVLCKKLSQAPEDYKTIAPHVALTTRLMETKPALAPLPGDRVSYLIRAGREALNERAVLPEEDVPIDWLYYAMKQLIPPIQRILDVVSPTSVLMPSAITAPICKNTMLGKFVTTKKRKKRQRETPVKKLKVPLSDKDIRSFFG